MFPVKLILTRTKTLNKSILKRRDLLIGFATSFLTSSAFAFSADDATLLVSKVVGEINSVISSGKSEQAMIVDFEKIFAKYADVNIIARSALGPPARSASSKQLKKFTTTFRGYMARKYGKQFRTFIGGEINVEKTTDRGKFFEVSALVTSSLYFTPFDVTFRVSDRSGQNLFFDIIIEGISLLSSERVEIGALLDARKGSIDRLTNDLEKLG